MRDDVWDFGPPASEPIGDHDVLVTGTHLANKRIALLVTGGISAYRMPCVIRALRSQGADVVVFASAEALRFVTREALEWSSTHPVVESLSARSEHLSDDCRFDVYLLPQATYNTINKIRYGIADSIVTTTMASALGRAHNGEAEIVLAPAMHGSMHNPILTQSLRFLSQLGVHVLRPRDAYGKDNLLDTETLVAQTVRAISCSPLQGVPILVTAGSTPAPIDNVRHITNRFRGRLGILISQELWMRGAKVLHIHGDGPLAPPAYVPQLRAPTYDDYRTAVHDALRETRFTYGVFSAAVADYQPSTVASGKIKSGVLTEISLRPTAKVIDEVRTAHSGLKMVTFKYEEGISHEQLMAIAQERVAAGHLAVVANRGEECTHDQQVAHLVRAGKNPMRLVGKSAIAIAIADFLAIATECGRVSPSGID